MEKYAAYSEKTQELLKRSEDILHENSRHIAGTKRFLGDLENDLLLAEAEIIAAKHSG